jgi:hypothetical protein
MVDRVMTRGTSFRDNLTSIMVPFQGLSYFIHIATLLPIAALLQRVLGPSLELQGYIGAVLALASIVLAWILGRVYRGPLFGILFAAFLSLSLAQLVWSRVGGPYLGGMPHVLAVALCGFLAGRRNSVVFALLAGALTWLCLYNHYQARVCLPLVYVAVFAGATHRPRAVRTVVLQSVVITLVLVAAYVGNTGGLPRCGPSPGASSATKARRRCAT